MALQVPFWLSVIYLIFGQSFFFFSWVDDVLIFFIKHYVSNLSPSFILLQFLYFLSSYVQQDNYDMGYGGFGGFHVVKLIADVAITGFFWNRTMYESVGAIRYMDPSWSEVSDGERLWPSIAYGLGIV